MYPVVYSVRIMAISQGATKAGDTSAYNQAKVDDALNFL